MAAFWLGHQRPKYVRHASHDAVKSVTVEYSSPYGASASAAESHKPIKNTGIITSEMTNQEPTAAKRIHFKNPPIVDAIIAIHIVPLPDTAIEDFRECVDEMKQLGYQEPQPLTQHQFQITVEQGSSSFEGMDRPHGLKFVNDDATYAVQFNKSGFIFSRLGQYQTWEGFRDEAAKVWRVFSTAVGAAEITSYGVRYINKVQIPNTTDIQEYLLINPRLPDSIPQEIQECFMRLGLPIQNPQGKLVHQQILLPPERLGYSSVLLDNDFQFPAVGKTTAQVWEEIETVRDVKDEYFEKFTTQKLRETFDA